MNFKSILFIPLFAGAFSPAVGFAHDGDGHSAAHIAELALHRIERLVILKKIDEGFQNRFSSLSLADAPAGNPAGAKYLASSSQVAGSDGTANAVDIYMDEMGKSLSFETRSGAASVNAPAWPDKDALTLAESAMHYIEGAANDPTIDPFNDAFSSMKLSQGKDSSGATIAIVDVTNTKTPQTLRVLVKTDGTVESSSILP